MGDDKIGNNEMYTKDNERTVDGITIAEHRKMGQSFANILQALDEMTEYRETPLPRRLAYSKVNKMVDAALDGLADVAGVAFRENDVDAYPYPLFTREGDIVFDKQGDACTDEAAGFTNADGISWLDWAEVFPLMCPITGRNCHSLCACYRDRRTRGGAIGTAEDYLHRVDGYTYGRCERFSFAIGADRD